ncbi:MAG: zinc dependent phospholipase C family protein [Ferruginibacter sp.]
MIKRFTILLILLSTSYSSFCWGFFGHKKINYNAVFLLPPAMMVFYKPNINFLEEHAVDPDKRRYAVKDEAPRHYIDIDLYGIYPFENLPRKWNDAVEKFSLDTVNSRGIVPWHILIMQKRLTNAFKEKNYGKILKYSAEIGHYISDSHVPLHASHNHNGQHTNQHGIHGFWESRIPELLADKEFDFFIGKAQYLKNPEEYIWDRVLESSLASDSVLKIEKALSLEFKNDRKYAFEERNNLIAHQYSSAYTKEYNKRLNGMVEKRMRLAIYSTACFLYTAWVNAGQPDLKDLASSKFTEKELADFEEMNQKYNKSTSLIGREE